MYQILFSDIWVIITRNPNFSRAGDKREFMEGEDGQIRGRRDRQSASLVLKYFSSFNTKSKILFLFEITKAI